MAINEIRTRYNYARGTIGAHMPAMRRALVDVREYYGREHIERFLARPPQFPNHTARERAALLAFARALITA